MHSRHLAYLICLLSASMIAPTIANAQLPRPKVDWGTLDRLHAGVLDDQFMIEGATSCAAASCHGGPRPAVANRAARRGSEYQLWLQHDPHSRSWATISGDESVAIMGRLGILVEGQIVDQAGFDNCLACHNTTKRFNEPRSLVERREGVGCASCHGPSQRWADNHDRYDWSPESATSDGFVNSGDLYARARMCASCHVGDKDRDMNHDIIAAGHPALKYEFATYHARLPKHWRDPESGDATYYEAQLWLAGQVAATDASLSLLNARATQSQAVSRWPEFAAYDCASCHHSLGLESKTRKASTTARYSSWNDAGLRWLIDHRQSTGQASVEDFALIDALSNVKQLMESAAVPGDDNVAMATENARRVLAAWYDSAGASQRLLFRSDQLAALVANAAGNQQTFSTWESSAQFYLAAVASRASWPHGWQGPLLDSTQRMRLGLRYPDALEINRDSTTPGMPTLTSRGAMRLGIEIGGQLGPVPFMPEEVKIDEEQESRQQLRQMIEQINRRWDKIQSEKTMDQPRVEEVPDEPRRRPLTPQELLEQLRNRNSGRDE